MSDLPFHQWVLPDGGVTASFFRTPDGYRVNFPKLADFDISDDGHRCQAHPLPGISAQTIEHIYLNQVEPLMFSRQGRLVFHGGAVEVPGGAAAFLGPSGRGKSTLTASFARCGHRFLTDDSLLLEKTQDGYIACPSHASIRLWQDSGAALLHEGAGFAAPVQHTPKLRVLSDGEIAHCEEKRPLVCAYFLGEGRTSDVQIESLAPSEALIELAKNSFLLDTKLAELIARHFDELTQLVSRPIFFRLDYPRNYDKLASVRQAVLSHCQCVGSVRDESQ